MKLLLMISALLEGILGVGLLIVPSVAVTQLLGVPLDTPAGLVAGRIAGAALIAIAIACWQARNGERGSATTGVVEAMLFYNLAAMLVLAYAGIRLELRSPLLWPAILLHAGLGVWCLLTLWFTRRRLLKAAVDQADSQVRSTGSQ
jgi:Kef-type K+ transport system membrane component KefB